MTKLNLDVLILWAVFFLAGYLAFGAKVGLACLMVAMTATWFAGISTAVTVVLLIGTILSLAVGLLISLF